jgi:hypothetical protein
LIIASTPPHLKKEKKNFHPKRIYILLLLFINVTNFGGGSLGTFPGFVPKEYLNLFGPKRNSSKLLTLSWMNFPWMKLSG